MTNQEVFDKAMEAMLEQEAFAWKSEFDECSYFDNRGNRCMIGHLGTKNQAEKWSEEFEDVIAVSVFLDIDPHFASSLQINHDEIARDNIILNEEFPTWNKSSFIKGMRKFAKDNDLEFDYT